ncbi:MAG: phosphoribosylanthranilate isomerase [Gammaproteobacteria bacterium]
MDQNSLLIRTRVKFCGITRVEDALHAAAIGVDAIGLVFYAKSPRAVSIKQAKLIVDNLPPFITKVGLFVNSDRAEIDQISTEVGLNVLQFHGDESPEDCEQYDRPFIKAVRVQAETDLQQLSQQFQNAQGLLLDAYDKTMYGGTGKSFDWSIIPEDLSLPIILAGGLSPDNVSTAIKNVKPYAVDVSGGIEQSKGIKDTKKMNVFMNGVSNGCR